MPGLDQDRYLPIRGRLHVSVTNTRIAICSTYEAPRVRLRVQGKEECYPLVRNTSA